MDADEIIARVIEYAEHPRGKKHLDDPTLRQAGGNPGCGDVIVWMLDVDGDDRVTAAGWDGKGCNLSQAGASMLHDRLAGMTLREVLALPHDTLVQEIGEQLAMTRPTCSSLALNVLKTGVYRWLKEQGRGEGVGGAR